MEASADAPGPAGGGTREQLTSLRQALDEERALLDRLARIAPALASELDPDRLMQRLTDEATSVVGAQFGAFFYNVTAASGESYMLYTLSGAPREAFEKFGMPRNTAVFGPTFAGEGVVRVDDITKDPRYGKSAPHHGMPKGHLPVVSYLAVPVRSMKGDVLGGLFFGHAQAAKFTEREERAAVALSALAGAALDNARLFRSLGEREAALEAMNRRHRLVDEATREGVWYWDVPANMVEWNDALLASIGIERSTWGGSFDDWFSRVHPDDQPRLAAALKLHLERREPYAIDLFRLRHASGDYRWFTTVGQAEWGDDGAPLRMAGSVRDVTDKKVAADALRASEHRYAQILDSVGDMIFCKDESLTVIYANAAARRFYATTLEGVRVPRDDPGDRDVFSKGRPVEHHEEPSRAPTGELRWLHTIKSPLFDEHGKVVELVGVSRDVTSRRRAFEAQRRLAAASEILARSIDYEGTLANVAKAMVPEAADWCAVDVVDDKGSIRRIAVAHPDEEKIALAYDLQRRYPSRDDAPHGVSAVIRSRRPELVPEIPDALLVASAADAEHLALIRALGLTSYIIVPMLAHERVLGTITLVSDSARRFDESDLAFAEELARRAGSSLENALLYREVRELNASLERRVDERTAALVAVNKELESFSYTVSHDLRAPIRHVSGFVDLLRDRAKSKLDEKELHYIDTVKAAATQMGALIDGLLAFSRLGRTQLSKRRVALSELVASVVRETAPDTAGRAIRWAIGELPEVSADPTMIQLVLSNLIANAVKYTRRQASARIEIGAASRERDVLVWVKDDGPGFNMDYAEKMFGVFQRLHSDAEFEGTGIGLATARRIVQRHGGRIWAEGAVGSGASFFFTIPNAEASS